MSTYGILNVEAIIIPAKLRWLGTIMYGFTIKIKMLVSAKTLPTGYLKKSVFTKYLLTYLLQQTKCSTVG